MKSLRDIERFCLHCSRPYLTRSGRLVYCSAYCERTHISNVRISVDTELRTGKQYSSMENYLARLRSIGKGRKGLTTEFLIGLYRRQGGACAVTGVPLTHTRPSRAKEHVYTNASLDKIDPRGGYVESNVRLVCYIVNTMKHTMSDDTLYDWCRAIVKGIDGKRDSED